MVFFLGIRQLEEIFVAAEDPSVSGVSGRYATALFELARDQKSVDSVKADLDKFSALLTESPDFLRLVRSPVFTADAQAKALEAVLARAGIGGIAANFLKVLTKNRRLFAVADVIRAFRALVAQFKGEATAEVTVAEPLSDANLDALKAALKTVSGKDVDLNVKVDPSIIADLAVDEAQVRFVGAILRLIEAAGLEAIVEGIETQAQLDLLIGLGCRYGQGYLLGRPAAAEAISLPPLRPR